MPRMMWPQKQEKFMEGLNDELSMQLMVATFNNYQDLVDRAIMIKGKQQEIESRKRKYGQGKYNSGAQQKPRFTPHSGGHTHNHGGHTHNGGSSHNPQWPYEWEWEWRKQWTKPYQRSNTR